MWYSDNPVADADRYAEEQERRLEKRPECCMCDSHIQDEFAYKIGDKWFCRQCIRDSRVDMEDFDYE